MALARIDGSVLDNVPRPVPGAFIAVLTQPANTSIQPGSPLASIFSDVNGTQPLANPFNADGSGNYFFYIASGTYTIQIYGGTLANQVVLADQAAGTPATGVVLQHNSITNSTQTLLNLAQGAGMTISESSGTVTFAAAASAITFKTNNTNNSTQTTLNLSQGTGMTISESGGTVTFTAAAAPVFQTNGVSNTSQSTLNLQNGANITITNPSTGNVAIAATLPAFQVNSTPTSNQLTINFQSGANVLLSNPSAGNISIATQNLVARTASADFTAQTATIATTTIFTTSGSGAAQYVLFWDAKTTTLGTTTLGPLTITYTDPDSNVIVLTAAAMISAGTIATTNSTNSVGSTGALIGIPLTLNVANSSNIQYGFTYAGTGQYNLHIRLEQLPT